MRLAGENWETWLYPMLCRPAFEYTRRLFPHPLVSGAVAQLMKFRAGDSLRRYLQAVTDAYRNLKREDSLASFLDSHLHFIASFYLQMADLMQQDRRAIKARQTKQIVLKTDGLREATSRKQAVLVPTLQLNVPFRIMFADLPNSTVFNVLLHSLHPGVPRILQKIDQGWKVLHLEERFVARDIVRAFQRKEVVVCNIDHAYPDTEVTLAPVLGRMAVVPSGIFRLALKHDALVVPLYVKSCPEGTLISASEIFDWQSNAQTSLPVASMLARVQRHLDDAVLAAPHEWLGWGNLIHRWSVWRKYVGTS